MLAHSRTPFTSLIGLALAAAGLLVACDEPRTCCCCYVSIADCIVVDEEEWGDDACASSPADRPMPGPMGDEQANGCYGPDVDASHMNDTMEPRLLSCQALLEDE